MTSARSFARLVSEAMARKGLGLREACRRAGVDPSYLSKVLAGKRSPPSDEATLLRLAAALESDAVALTVAAGLIPADWGGLSSDPDLLRAVHELATSGRRPSPRRAEAPPPRPVPAPASRPARVERPAPIAPLPPRGLSEELL